MAYAPPPIIPPPPLPPSQVLMDDPENAPCREAHRRCRAVVKKVEAGAKLLSPEGGMDVEGATREWRAATALEPDNPLFVGPLLLRVSGGQSHSAVAPAAFA